MLAAEWYAPVKTKHDFVGRYSAGEFGNASPTWTDLDAFLSYGRKEFGSGSSSGLYHLRNGRVAGGTTWYKQHWSQAVARWIEQDHREDWYCSEQVPERVEQSLLLQGEVMDTERGLYLLWSDVAKPMRTALAERSDSAWGLSALLLLRRSLCINSLEWLMELLQRYTDHVVEFSTYGYRWGTLPNFNTVFWEVRRY